MITAVILARCTSSRLPNKHFYKIGDKELINIIIDNIKKNKLISQIYLATGTKKKNFLFQKIAKKKKIKIYFHKNEDNVTERIYNITKKIKTKYTLLISGDCCLVDNSFIKRLYKDINLNNSDFVKTKKKLIHEGIKLFKTDIWKKVNKLSIKNYQREHPGYVVNEKPELFNIGKYKPQKYEIGKKFRISVDTESDLDFFNKHYYYLKSKSKKFNLINVLRSKNFKFLNKHVDQKKPGKNKGAKYVILTAYSKTIGLGHLSRSKTLFREINETITSDVKIICVGKNLNDHNFIYNNRIKFVNKINYQLFSSQKRVIIDLPKIMFNELKNNQINKKNIVIIDNYRHLSKPKFIIPSIRNFKKFKNPNIYSGKNFLIVTRKILKFKSFTNKMKNEYILLSGSSNLSLHMINFFKNNKNIRLLIGPLVSKEELKIFKNMKIKFKKCKMNYFDYLSKAKEVYCKFGISTYEMILLNKRPIIIQENENNEVKKDIKYLYNKGLIKLIENKKIISKKKSLKIDINNSLKNIVRILK